MISDFVKGAQKNAFDWDVRQGIALHRAIDNYTDTHPIVAGAKEIFRPHYRLYSGAIIDILFDHFLAADETEFTEESLRLFSVYTYAVLEEHQQILPLRFAQMLPYMKQGNWLLDYRSLSGVQKSLQRMVHRAAYISDSSTAYQLLQQHYSLLSTQYHQFFPQLKSFAKAKMEELLGDTATFD